MTLNSLRTQVRQVARSEMAALGLVAHCDSWMTGHSRAFSQALARHGWVGMTLPRRYGGAAASHAERFAVVEELLALGAPVAAHWFADRQVGPALVRHGTQAQRERYLPGIVRGECYFAIGMSEPDSGSDLASVRTRAELAGDHWVLAGTKTWTSHAHEAHHMLVLARTDLPEGGDRRTGLSQFVIDLSLPGITVRPIAGLDGAHHFNDVFFDDVVLSHDALLGRRGQGWAQVMQELAFERSGPERVLSTMPLLSCLVERVGASSAQLGILLAELRSLRALSRAVAEALDRGETPAVEAALVKDLGTRFEARVIDVARALAPVAPDLRSADPYPRLLAEAIVQAPGRTLRGGTTEILRGIVARALVDA